MMSGRKVILSLCAMWWANLALPALACPPPPPPERPGDGESADAFKARMDAAAAAAAARYDQIILDAQRQAWDKAASVVIARVDKVQPIKAVIYGPMNRAYLTPLSWLKGKQRRGTFTIADTGETDCGPTGGGDATAAKAGDLVVVYASEGKLGNNTMIANFAADRVRDPRIKAALDVAR